MFNQTNRKVKMRLAHEKFTKFLMDTFFWEGDGHLNKILRCQLWKFFFHGFFSLS